MFFKKDQLLDIKLILDNLIDQISEFENRYKKQLNNVHPNYFISARNLVHYLALRTFDMDVSLKLQNDHQLSFKQ